MLMIQLFIIYIYISIYVSFFKSKEKVAFRLYLVQQKGLLLNQLLCKFKFKFILHCISYDSKNKNINGNKIINGSSYENISLMGALNINTLTQTNSNNTPNHFTDFCDLFALSNLVNVKTYIKSVCGTSLDTMLTHKPRSLYNTSDVTTSLSDCHKLISRE